MLRSRMSRRAFLTLVAGTAAGVVAAAGCGATPTATPLPPTATVVAPTKPPVPTNTPVPPAPVATTAPAVAPTAVPATAVPAPATAVPATAVPATAVPAVAALPFDINDFTGGFVAAPESVYSYDDMSKKYTIKWMRSSWYNQGQPIPEGDPIKKYIDRVLNVDFQLLPSQVGVFQDVNLRVASGEGAPDVWWPSNLADATKLANDGVAIPDLRPYIEKYCPNYMNLIAAAGGKDLFFNATTVKGKMVAFARPLFTGEPAESVFVRQDWLTKLGLQPPKTVDDLYAIAEKF